MRNLLRDLKFAICLKTSLKSPENVSLSWIPIALFTYSHTLYCPLLKNPNKGYSKWFPENPFQSLDNGVQADRAALAVMVTQYPLGRAGVWSPCFEVTLFSRLIAPHIVGTHSHHQTQILKRDFLEMEKFTKSQI